MTEPYFNLTSLINATNATLVTESGTINTNDDFDSKDDLEQFVSGTVFILFSFIFFAGLIGNGLVVMGKVSVTKT